MTSSVPEDTPHDQLADTVRALIKATGLALRPLGKRTDISAQTWSAYQTKGNDRHITPAALERLLQIPSNAPTELKERARRLCAEIRQPPAPSSPAPGPDATSPRTTMDPGRPAPARRPRWLKAGVVGVLLVSGLGALAYVAWPSEKTGPRYVAPSRQATPAPTVRSLSPRPRAPQRHVGAAPPHRSPTTSPSCQRRRRYRVHTDGNIVDAAKHPIGAVAVGDVFVRDDSAGHRPMKDRYYGTIAGQPPGYVLQEKLTYIDTTCVAGD